MVTVAWTSTGVYQQQASACQRAIVLSVHAWMLSLAAASLGSGWRAIVVPGAHAMNMNVHQHQCRPQTCPPGARRRKAGDLAAACRMWERDQGVRTPAVRQMLTFAEIRRHRMERKAELQQASAAASQHTCGGAPPRSPACPKPCEKSKAASHTAA